MREAIRDVVTGLHLDKACSQNTKFSPVQASKVQTNLGRQFIEDIKFAKTQSHVQIISLL